MVRDNDGWADAMIDHTPKRRGGPRIAAWSRAMRWAATVGFDGWEACVDEVVEMSRAAGALASLLSAMSQLRSSTSPQERRKSATESMPARLDAHLRATFGAAYGSSTASELGPPAVDALTTRKQRRTPQPPIVMEGLPAAALCVPALWLSSSGSVSTLHCELQRKAAEQHGHGSRLRIGVDTEWVEAGADDVDEAATGTDGKADKAAPHLAVVQIATAEHAWVIDALGDDCAHAVGALLRWALESDDQVTVLGFAFHGDLAALRRICGRDLQPRSLVDLQPLATSRGEDTPSLQRVCARTLEVRLDKREQCSDWARRPLTQSQFAYAALDAAVLVQLHDALTSRCGTCEHEVEVE